MLHTVVQLLLCHYFLRRGGMVLESRDATGYILKIGGDIIYTRDLYIVIADASGTRSDSLGLFFEGLDVDKVSKTKESEVAGNGAIQLSL